MNTCMATLSPLPTSLPHSFPPRLSSTPLISLFYHLSSFFLPLLFSSSPLLLSPIHSSLPTSTLPSPPLFPLTSYLPLLLSSHLLSTPLLSCLLSSPLYFSPLSSLHFWCTFE